MALGGYLPQINLGVQGVTQEEGRPRREFNRFESKGVVDNQRFDGRRRGGQSDDRFHNQGGRQDGSRNSTFWGQNDRNRYLNL
ncbi:hypothetical protein TNCV_4949311 [Trichonephila clavipes]|nr:hypothetical protein TNCV_4949311 [Trichonephila clavipes]